MYRKTRENVLAVVLGEGHYGAGCVLLIGNKRSFFKIAFLRAILTLLALRGNGRERVVLFS
jgi:hypothetical protein